MAKDNVWDWDTTAANNTDVGGISIAENMLRASVNNAMREMMSEVRELCNQGSDISSVGGAPAIAATGTSFYVKVTGTTTITSFGTVNAGVWRWVTFTGALTLTHNATSLILPGGANITTAAGDAGLFMSEGSGNWRCLCYQAAAGLVVAATDTEVRAATSTTKVVTPASPIGMIHLETKTASSSATIDFVLTSWLSTYRAFRVVFHDVLPATDNVQLVFRTSTDGGSTFAATGGDYTWGASNVNDAGVASDAGSTANSFIQIAAALSNVAGETCDGTVTIYNPAGTVSKKKVVADAAWITASAATNRTIVAGRRDATADVDAIRLLMGSGNIASGTFALYGIR